MAKQGNVSGEEPGYASRWGRVLPTMPEWLWWTAWGVAAVLGAYAVLLGVWLPPWLMTVSYLLVFVVGLWWWLAWGRTRSWVAAALVLFWVIWAVTLPLTMMWSPGSKAVQREVQGMALMALLCVGLLGLLSGVPRLLVRMRWWWAGLWAIMVPLVVWEAITGQHLDQGQPEAWFRAVGRSPFAALINPNNLACVLVAVVGVTLVWARRAVGRARWVCMAVVVTCGITVWLSNSRSAMAAYFVISLVGAYAVWRANRHGDDAAGRSRWPLTVAGVGVGVTALAFVVPVLVPGLHSSNPVGDLVTPSSDIAKSDSSRVGLLRAGLSYFMAAPLLGKGAGSFEPLVAKRIGAPMNLHNSLLELLCQYGLIVVLPLIVALVLCVWLLWRGWRMRAVVPDHAKDAGWTLAFLLLAYMLTAGIVSSALTMPLWWAMLAHAVACAWCLELAVREASTDAVASAPVVPNAPLTTD